MKKALQRNDAKRAAARRSSEIKRVKAERRAQQEKGFRSAIRTVPMSMLWPSMSRRDRVGANLAAAGMPELIFKSLVRLGGGRNV